MRAGIAVRAATKQTVPGTTVSNCQSGGTGVASGSTAEISAMTPGIPRRAPASAGSISAAESPCAHLLRGRTERARERRGVPGVERGRPGDEDRVDGREGDECDRDHEQHLVQSIDPRAVDH
jgi:hypothetical protein